MLLSAAICFQLRVVKRSQTRDELSAQRESAFVKVLQLSMTVLRYANGINGSSQPLVQSDRQWHVHALDQIIFVCIALEALLQSGGTDADVFEMITSGEWKWLLQLAEAIDYTKDSIGVKRLRQMHGKIVSAKRRGVTDCISARRCDWPRPTQFVKIHADVTTIIISTDIIGKAEFAESLFRERLEELTKGRAADEGTVERKMGDTPMLEMRFDRSGKTLQLIVNAMRGYPMDETLSSVDSKMILADCEFYKLPSLIAKFDSSSKTRAAAWNPLRIESVSHSIDGSLLARNASGGSWECNGLTSVLRIDDNQWVECKIMKTTSKRLMFGVVEDDNFSTHGYFGSPLKGVGYCARTGNLHYPSAEKLFAGVSGADDNIRIDVRMSDVCAQMTVSKNGCGLGTVELSEHIAVTNGLVFAVCTYNAGDEVKIVGSGYCG